MTTRHYGQVETLTVTLNSALRHGSAGATCSGAGDSHIKSVQRVFIDDDGTYPNNSRYPTLLLQSVFAAGTEHEGARRIVADGQWTSPWSWGIFEYHHYHSKAWELLLCVRGEASVQLGGPSGPTVSIAKGDLVLIPPGVAHKQLNARGGFTLLGAYPTTGFDGSIDTLTGSPTDEERERIKGCYVPSTEPILGFDVRKLCDTESDKS
eukprot:CAMPEP_0197726606 /NCGR_PEP_ID=MMETSP1434-20131217/16396_1 /TAXON_ID=265543 /ORGANISM="Minutocellus polymorphus, Strain CCMP3303" /LENGTH=207 /DNA_ID=CAMNT_0043312591 /DNA_START=171 /DNA_END=794 /DNA_ORIENTATION=+